MLTRWRANYPAHTVNAINRVAEALERIAIVLETGEPAVRGRFGVLESAAEARADRCATCDFPAGEPEPVACPECGR